ncbi:MAG: hypothetical protein BWY67_00734 [Bacteroidetes bacterium ADurb.Bin397]|nr:MAG: hypothetical protein BWY67_00734 [Bacteroidetes bacterium ADurb.Bin397]
MNKENFWNGLYEQYPKAVKEFCDFIDEYKAENNWNELFGDKVKFHHVPVEMQLGIWMEFIFNQGCGSADFSLEGDCFEIENLYEWASEWFREREKEIEPS